MMSNALKTALVCIFLATVLFVIGFVTNDWMEFVTQSHVSSSDFYWIFGNNAQSFLAWGLWKVKYCSGTSCQTAKITNIYLKHNNMEVWFHVVQAFECFGLIFLAVSVVTLLLLMFMALVNKRRYLNMVIVSSFAGAGCITVGSIIFSTQLDHHEIAWSMGVALTAAGFMLITGVMGIVELK